MKAEVERLFDLVVALPADQRAAFLAEHCSDPGVRCEVESLLEHDGGAETFLRGAVSSEAESMRGATSFQLKQRVGPYEIGELIGRGGMGAVYGAQRADGKFEQLVAIKVVQDRLATSFGADRLQQECRILAGLEHPNIARLFDAGMSDNGIPYFVMERIDGVPIDIFCRDHALSLHQRLRLFLQVCDAVQFAHQKLVVHRDLKPENILVTKTGIPKLLDFGIAKVLDPSASALSQTVTQVMTPEYASPEQVQGEPVSTLTDIYSLGCVLYKMVTGVSPHQLQGVSPAQAVQIICEREVPDPRKFADVPADVAHILGMALRKEPQRRYRSVEQLAGDIQRLLGGQPLLAGPDTAWYRYGKFVRRNWLAVTAVTAVVVAVGAGAGIATWQARRAERRFADVRRLANVFLFDFEKSIRNVPGTTRARELVVTTALEYLQKLAQDAAGDSALKREVASAYEKVGDIQGSANVSNVGNTAGAVRSYEQALSLRRALGDPVSGTPSARLEYARLLNKVAKIQERINDVDGAIRNSQEAIAGSKEVLKSKPDDATALAVMATAYMELSSALHRRSDVQGAIESAQQGVVLAERLAAASPRDRFPRLELASGYWMQGSLFALLHKNTEGAAGFEKALTIYRQLLAEFPDDAEIRRYNLMVLSRISFLEFGDASKDKAQGLKAVAHGREAYTMAEQFVAADPANVEALNDVMATAIALGQYLNELGDHAEARRLLERGVSVTTELVQRDPGSRENQLNLAEAY